MQVNFTTKASPAQVLAAMTDFSDARPKIWSGTLDPAAYELREIGDTWAVARESTAKSPFWVVSRYDWSDPTAIRADVVESSYGGGGQAVMRIKPGEAGGSRVSYAWDSTGARGLNRVLLFVMHHLPLGRLLARQYRQTLDRYAEGGVGPGSSTNVD